MKFLPALLLGTALSLAACKQTATMGETSNVVQSAAPVMAKTPALSAGMVASANPHATRAGVEVLEAGGSAVDAAIAVQAMLGLTEPQSSGLGGGAFMMVYDSKTGEVWNYDGREAAPAAITPELFMDENGKPLGRFAGIASGRSTGVPGAVVMLHRAHQDYGTLAWGPQMDAAIKQAEDGFEISPRMGDVLSFMSRAALNRQKASREYFYQADGTTPKAVGTLLKNPEYAETLRAIKVNPRALLEGPIAEKIIAAVREEPLPGTLTLADMAAYQPKKRPALCSEYRKHTVCGAQPPSSGGVAVQSILGVLENYDMGKIGPTKEGWHNFIEASFMAYADRDQYIADPDFVDNGTGLLLNKSYLKSRAELINKNGAIKDVKAGNPAAFLRGKDATPDVPGTSHFTVVDKDGLVVSMTTTIEAGFGSERMAAGFLLNNQLTDFSFKTHDDAGLPIANAPAPGKRPRSSMAPSIVFAPNGEFLFSTGSPGGSSIIAYTAKTIVAIVDWGYTPQEAIELPNVIARNGTVRLEAKGLEPEEDFELGRAGPAAEFGMAEEMVNGLEKLGHKVRRSKGEISGLHIIYRNDDGSLVGGADPRREGVATGL